MPTPLSPNAIADAKSPSKTADDINDMFNELDQDDKSDKTDKIDKVDKVDKKPAKQEDDEDEEIKLKEDKKGKEDEDEEIEFKDPDDDDIEKLDLEDKNDEDITAPPRKKEILAKFPELFKTFPFIEKVLYRDKQYTELFGSFDDAKELAEKAEVFNGFERDLLSGKTEDILKNVKDTDPKAFDKIVDNYLTSLHKVDKDAYFDVVNNLNKRLVQALVEEANSSESDELKQAALLVHQFLFGSSKWTPPKVRSAEKPEDKESEAEKERLAYVQERFESSSQELQTKVDNTLKATISEYIDPKGVMTPYMKRNAVNDALKSVKGFLDSDTSFRRSLDKTWRAAFDAKFSKDSLDRIRALYLSRARQGLSKAIKDSRAEALKDYTPAPREKKEEDEIEEKTPAKQERRLAPGRPSQLKGKNEMKKGESVAEFFARD